jgi:hypothetical protein
LTNSEQSPTLSKAALLNLVEWVKKYHNKSSYIEIHEMGESSPRKSPTFNSVIRNNIPKKIANTINKYERGK